MPVLKRVDSISTNAMHSRAFSNPTRRDHPTHDPRQDVSCPGHSKKSPDQLKHLRENNQCFECEQTGHMAKDCPKHHRLPFKPQAKVSSLQSSAVGITNADIRSAALEEGLANGLYGMAISSSFDPDSTATRHLIAADRTLAHLYRANRFTLLNWGGPDTYLLKDKHNDDSYIIYYEQMSDPEFDPAIWLLDLKLKNYNDLIFTAADIKAPSWSMSREEHFSKKSIPYLSPA
ncbi:hypothetical protein DFH29DRAFT_1004549 [Suillus ampliporus]|nr:hypothetical protein DFH29DRAFT_1004549 [Suillus ampliporus]